MRGLKIVCPLVLSLCLTPAGYGADWMVVAKDKVRSVELDRASIIKSDAGTKVAWGRIIVSNEHAEVTGYKTLRVLNRYDCANRSFIMVKRLYLSADDQVLREESLDNPKETVVRPGTVDERFYNEVCPSAPASAVATKKDGKGAKGGKGISVAELQKIADEAGKRAKVAAQEEDAATPFRSKDIRFVRAEAKSATPSVSVEATDHPPVDPARVSAAIRRAQSQMLTGMRAQYTQARKPEAPAEGGHAEWGYEGANGPQAWGSIRPDFATCAKGQRQSPIDIRDGIKVDQEPIAFDYKPAGFRIIDNGHTIQIGYGEGSQIKIMGRTYTLQQFHFHLPAEEMIEGKRAEMVVHLVHKDMLGHLAVVAVEIEKGSANPLVQTLWNNLPLERNEEYAPATQINVQDLLPAQREYYSYMGSLTTPPCTEGVLWLVLKRPITLSEEQIGIFARFYRNNARPVQPTNARIIKESRQ